MSLVFQEHFDDINFILSKIGQRTYKSVNEIDNEQIQLLKEIRSKQSELFNVKFLENNEMIAQQSLNINNVRIRALVRGIQFSFYYKHLPNIFLRTVEKRSKYAHYFWDYEIPIRVVLSGLIYLNCKVYYKLYQWLLKHGVRYVDKFLNLFMKKDSLNKQWVGAILMCALTYQFSTGIEKVFDIYSVYQGYRQYSDDFQSDIRKFSKSITYFEKKVD